MAKEKYQYHFSGSKTSTSKDEPLFLTKFRATFVLPAPLQAKYGAEVLSEQLRSVGGLSTDKLPEVVEQFYRAHKRRFLGTVVETDIDLDLVWEVNVTREGVTYPYNIMRDWCKLGYDPMTGYQTIKEDYTGKLTLEIHNKLGQILKKVYFPIFFPITPPGQFDLEYASEGQYELAMTFAGENFTDLMIAGQV